jgi:3-dehydroquinate synthase
MPKTLTVRRDGKAAYDIILDTAFDGLKDRVEALGVQGRRMCVVTDSTVARWYLEPVKEILAQCCRQVVTFVFPAGEESKNLETVQKLYETLIESHFDRKDWLVALGGGVVGDLCGYGAATYLRGVSFIQIPTTLLSQVDSSIGGKTGVDFASYKNMVGAFHMPRLVYANVSTLLTLSEEQFSSGMGEVIKHGLIQDESYYQWLWDNRMAIEKRDLSVCMEMIARSDEIKRGVVEQDPSEQGVRALLNFGHTLGHALEKQMGFAMLHGHCVGLGCLGAMRICVMRGYVEEECLLGLRRLMESLHMPTKAGRVQPDRVLADTKSDKKMDGDTIRFILLRAVGEAFVDRTVTSEEMRAGLLEILSENEQEKN